MTQPPTPAGSPSTGSGPAAYLIGSAEPEVLAEIFQRVGARRVSDDLLVADLTDSQVDTLREEFHDRALIEPDAPLDTFGP